MHRFQYHAFIYTYSLSSQTLDLLPSRKAREGLSDVTSIHELLTNQTLLFSFDNSSNTLT